MPFQTISRSNPPEYTTLGAAQLIEACTGGDAGAWEEFLRRYHNLVALDRKSVV